MYREADSILRDLNKHFGLSSRLVASLGGRWVFRALKKEMTRVSGEPPTFYERSPDLTAVRPSAANAVAVAA
jgi:hypothetical protein